MSGFALFFVNVQMSIYILLSNVNIVICVNLGMDLFGYDLRVLFGSNELSLHSHKSKYESVANHLEYFIYCDL